MDAHLFEIFQFFFEPVYCIGEILVDNERDWKVIGVNLQPESDKLVEWRKLWSEEADRRSGRRESGTLDVLIRENGGIFAAL